MQSCLRPWRPPPRSLTRRRRPMPQRRHRRQARRRPRCRSLSTAAMTSLRRATNSTRRRRAARRTLETSVARTVAPNTAPREHNASRRSCTQSSRTPQRHAPQRQHHNGESAEHALTCFAIMAHSGVLSPNTTLKSSSPATSLGIGITERPFKKTSAAHTPHNSGVTWRSRQRQRQRQRHGGGD